MLPFSVPEPLEEIAFSLPSEPAEFVSLFEQARTESLLALLHSMTGPSLCAEGAFVILQAAPCRLPPTRESPFSAPEHPASTNPPTNETRWNCATDLPKILSHPHFHISGLSGASTPLVRTPPFATLRTLFSERGPCVELQMVDSGGWCKRIPRRFTVVQR